MLWEEGGREVSEEICHERRDFMTGKWCHERRYQKRCHDRREMPWQQGGVIRGERYHRRDVMTGERCHERREVSGDVMTGERCRDSREVS